ncbi:MAG: T9SS type A sorting domain-containing protein, partial [Bacteroidota bacterium]|nr:T9SS type A sorting domain-containing protein [Bacteroidota bacterium]
VTATPTDPNASVQLFPATNVNGTEPERTTTAVVTAEDGTTELSYSVIFNVLPPNDDATLNNLTVSGSTIAGFNSGIQTYNYDLPYGTTVTPPVTATPTDPNASVQLFPATNVNGTEPERTTTAVVTAEDGTTELTYSVIFNVLPPNDDATLVDLQVDGETIAGFSSGTYTYMYYVAFSEVQVPLVTAFAADENAQIQITQAVNLDGTQEERTTTIVVTAEDEITELSYQVVFTKLPASIDATLSDLTVNGETIDGFYPAVVNYNMDLPEGSDIPVVLGTPNHEYAQILIQNATNLQGSEEERTTTIEVTAEDGETVREYSILFNIILSTTGTNAASIKLFPNPARTLVNIEASRFNTNTIQQIRLVSYTGKVIQIHPNLSGKQFNFSVNHLPDGIYILQIKTKDKHFVKRFTVVK